MKHLIRRVAVAAALATLSLAATAECWQWSAKERMPDITQEPASSAVAMDGTGATWVLIGEGPAGGRVLVSRRAPDGSWGQPLVLAQAAEPMIMRDAQMHVDDAGHALAFWAECDRYARCANKAAAFTQTSGWESPRQLPSGRVSVGMATNGRTLILSADDYGDTPAYLTPWSPDTGWGEAEVSGRFYHHRPKFSVAVNNAGQAVISVVNGLRVAVKYRRAPGVRWSEVARINELGRKPFTDHAPVALNESGQAMVVWSDRLPDRHDRINAKRLDVGRDVLLPTEILTSEEKDRALDPSVTMNARGQVVAGWMRQRGPDAAEQIQTRLGDPVRGWTPMLRLTQWNQSVGGPRLSSVETGQVVGLAATKAKSSAATGVASQVLMGDGTSVTFTHLKPEAYDAQWSTPRPLWLSTNRNGQALVAWAETPTPDAYELMLQLGRPRPDGSCAAP